MSSRGSRRGSCAGSSASTLGLVRGDDGLQVPVDLGKVFRLLPVDLRLQLCVPVHPFPGEALEALLHQPVEHRLLDVAEAQLHQVHLLRVELLRLHEHVLAHADLAEIVQEARVADLLQVLRGEVGVPVHPAAHPVHGLRQGYRVDRHPVGMAGGGGVPGLDCLHRCLDEAFEQGLDLLVEPVVLQGDRRLGRQGAHHGLDVVAEGHHAPVGVLR